MKHPRKPAHRRAATTPRADRSEPSPATTATGQEDLRREAAALAAEVRAADRRPARPPAPTRARPRPPARHEDGCSDCGTTDFRVTFTDGPTAEVEERRMGSRCWSCHEARKSVDGLARRAWQHITGRRSWPADLERITVPTFSDHPSAEPTPEPWGWVARDQYLDVACAIWPHRESWPESEWHRIPEPPPPAPEPPRPCRYCGATEAPSGYRHQPLAWFPVCHRCDTAQKAQDLPALAAEVIGLTRPVGTVDLRMIRWRWFHDTLPQDDPALRVPRNDPPGTPEPFGWANLDEVRALAFRRWPHSDDWTAAGYREAKRQAKRLERTR